MESKALTLISNARDRGALVYAGNGIENTTPLYKAEATELVLVAERDFHSVEGKLVPRKEVCDRIGEASGVDFIAENCGVKAENRDDDFGRRTSYVGYAQGRVRLPDGSWRNSTIEEYEFDPKVRALAEGGGEKKILTYMKAGRQRASTGARLRVIRQLVGMPTAFTVQEIGKEHGMVFSRIVQNTDMILSTPEGRRMATAVALGVIPSLFGPQAAPAPVEPEPMRNATPPSDDWGEPEAPASEPTEADKITRVLIEYLESGNLPPKGKAAIQAALDKGETDLIILSDLVSRAKASYDRAAATGTA